MAQTTGLEVQHRKMLTNEPRRQEHNGRDFGTRHQVQLPAPLFRSPRFADGPGGAPAGVHGKAVDQTPEQSYQKQSAAEERQRSEDHCRGTTEVNQYDEQGQGAGCPRLENQRC